MRVNSPRFPSESSLPSPNYQSVQSYSQSMDQFNFDQAFVGNSSQPPTPQPMTSQSDRSPNNSGMTSEYVKQEIRSLVRGRTQQQQIQTQAGPASQQQHQELTLSSQSLTLSSILSSADLDMFDLLNDSSTDFTQGLLNMGSDNTNSINSAVSHMNLNMNRTNWMVSVGTAFHLFIDQCFDYEFPINSWVFFTSPLYVYHYYIWLICISIINVSYISYK